MTEKDHLDELLNNVREKSMWQDIETAPKDGSVITILDEDSGGEEEVFWDGFMWGDQDNVYLGVKRWKLFSPKPKDTSP